MSKRTFKIISSLVAAAALTFGVTAPAASAASDNAGKGQVVQYRDTGWDGV